MSRLPSGSGDGKSYKPLTRQGYNRLAEEHRHLLEDVRPQVVEGIAIAAAEGDRSENAEYIYGKKRLREIDKRLRYLTGLIKDAQIIDIEFIRSTTVDFGATIRIQGEDDVIKVWTIVGVGEAEVADGTISYQSPVARAFWGKKIGDFVEINKPAGPEEFELLDIIYDGKSMQNQDPNS